VVLVATGEWSRRRPIRQELDTPGAGLGDGAQGASVRKPCRGAGDHAEPVRHDRMAEIQHPDFPGERPHRLFQSYTKERSQDRREDLLQTTERHLQKVARCDPAKDQALMRGRGKIGMAAGKALAEDGDVGKYFRILIQADGLSCIVAWA